MLADLAGHLVCFWMNGVSVRPDVVVHHVLAYCTVFFLDYPQPIYGWFVLCAPLATEFSTIFMNLKWFSKHYGFSTVTTNRLNTIWYITWFGTRCPVIFGMSVYMAMYWREIHDLCPRWVQLSGTVLILLINLLHVVWAILLFQKALKARRQQTATGKDMSLQIHRERLLSPMNSIGPSHIDKEVSDEKEGVFHRGRESMDY